MNLIFSKKFLQHDIRHPENKGRLKFFLGKRETEIINGEKFLGFAHSVEHIEKVRRACENEECLDADTPTVKDSYETACFAAGAAVQASESESFALVRPPGHHACCDRSMGFCLFNNMGIASKRLAGKGKKVFIIDFDIHHGNGTQDIVIGDDNIMFFSTHQHPLYPGTGLKDEKNCINVPLPFGTGDMEYVAMLEKRLVPALRKFSPDAVGLSAGFDSYFLDYKYMNPMAGFKLTKKSYERIKAIISEYRSFAVLEGGYNPESIRDGVRVFT